MPRKPPQTYDVRSQNTGAGVVLGVPLKLARAECSRLNAEARRPNPERRSGQFPEGEPWGMQQGVITQYEVVSTSGLVVG